jgi:GxxExxY protein
MDKTTIHMVLEPRKTELVNACYPIIGAIFEVYKTLGPGLPEYIYQEALLTELSRTGLPTHKELEYHPTYKGKPLNAYLKMDLVVETSIGNVIVECKALSALTEREHYQTFGYMRGTGWPVAILVNFGASPRAQIERFYNDNNTIAVF